MPLSSEISPKEKERVAALAYEGFRIEFFLAYSELGYNASTLYTSWLTQKLPENVNGYSSKYFVIPTGGYDASDVRYEMGATAGVNTVFTASWTGAGAGFSFNKMLIGIYAPNGLGGWIAPVYPSIVYTQAPEIIVPPLQPYSFKFQVTVS